MANNKYREYFDINEKYFSQINDSTISEDPDCWLRTFPHQTFIEMLKSMERCLARLDMVSLWIEGVYGTGKSQCVYALKKILEVSEEELRSYWDRYEPLKKKSDLLEKLVGHRQKGIVIAYRYASGGINSPRDLFLAIQNSVKNALVVKKLKTGESTLKESVIAWLDDSDHKGLIDSLLRNPDKEWGALFSQSTADEVLASLRKGGEVKMLMDNLFRLADKEGITALNIDADRLIKWVTDVIDQNNVKIIFIWDEFSDYFKNNRESLSEFQKIVELVNTRPFFFVAVTHEMGQLFPPNDTTWKKLRDRFIPISITLPDNIAFDLIGHALKVNSAAQDNWSVLADDLNNRVKDSRAVVMRETKITDPQAMKDIMPLHPVAALLLKNIASSFKSNQRSMFDFIKSTNTDDVKAFQWFIKNTGPEDDHPLLTVDMLWNFFYEKGGDNLTSDIRRILDTFPQQQNLRDDEQRVLKAILIMQAIDQRSGGSIDLFKVTEQNLSYAFEGITSGLDVSCKNLAKGLVTKGILVSNPIGNGRYVFAAAVLAGDQEKINNYKKDIRQNSTTMKLVIEGGLDTALPLSPALRLRFESEPNTGKITPVTIADYTRTINIRRDKPTGWNFHAVIAFAKDETEAASFRKQLKTIIADKQYENIVFIDALSTPLGLEAFEQYVDYSAMAMYYSSNNNSASRQNADKARHILDQDWKNLIYNGQFVVYTYANQEGEKLGNGQGVSSVLQTIVARRFPDTLAFDFANGLSETQLKLTQGPTSAQYGITGIVKSSPIKGIEKYILPAVWKVDKYWEALPQLAISKIKIAVEKLIEDAFSRDGQIPIGEVYDFLENKYGFAPCNLSAFLAGFLLKEYSVETYRAVDSKGKPDTMSDDKLAEMIGSYITAKFTGKINANTYIQKMTADEKAFYELTEKAWDVPADSFSSATLAGMAIQSKIRRLGLPVWCLSEVDGLGVYDIIGKYIELIQQQESSESNRIANEIGKIATVKTTLANNLSTLITVENCQEGMRDFLTSFEGGKILSLAAEIGADNNVLTDIRELFTVTYSCLWDKKTGEDEIRKLLTEYGIVKESNILLNVVAHSRSEAFKDWRDRLKFIGISHEALKAKFPLLAKALDVLLKICKQEDVLSDQLKSFFVELTAHRAEVRDLLNNEKRVFAEVYELYLDGLGEADIVEIKSKLPTGMFVLPKTDCNAKVKTAAEDFRKNQLKTQLFKLWKDKTDTKNPSEWSSHYRTPILCCVSEAEFETAKKAFGTLNRTSATETEIKTALAFLETTTLFEVLSDEGKRNAAFEREIIGEYHSLLPNLEKVRDALDRLSVDTYDWRDNPSVKGKVKQLAEAEYNSGGSDKALAEIDRLDDAQLKQYLKRLVKENMTVGIEIIMNGKK